jgi:sugar phosphate isomerase/epimerase
MILPSGCQSSQRQKSAGLFAKENLVAWCIVPFDSSERGPEERASMLDKLGFDQFAYDYRDKHIPSFKKEIEVLKEHQISLNAVWLWVDPANPWNEANRTIIDILEETGTVTELWVGFPDQAFEGKSDKESLAISVEALRSILERTEKMGCSLALYNHGGWYGEPENQLRIIEAMGSKDIKIVYNFHHGHHQVEQFEELLNRMLPHLSTININGMRVEGPKIITLGEGNREAEMLRIIIESGYDGPIGILGHTEGEDIEVVLERNLKGLELLRSVI